MPEIKLEHVTKRWAKFYAVEDLNLTIENNAFVTLLGPSGCGKTTLLRMVAGFNSIEGGTIAFNGRVINDIAPNKRNIGMVFQNYAVFPHMTVRENVAFGLENRHLPKNEIKRRVDEILETVKITQYADRLPERLSGGQQQRVALARTLNQNPSIILADEPVAALDPVTAHQVMADFKRINEEMNITILINIHHVDLALGYAQRVVGIRAGEIVYDGPASEVTQDILDSIYNGSAVPQAGGN